MDPITIAAVLQGVGALTSIFGGQSAKKDAEQAAQAQASADLKVTQEKLYQLGEEEKQLAGQTVARTAGSGVKVDKGSPLTILAEQAKTFAREKMITSQVGAEKASMIKQRGRMAGRQALWGGWSQGISQGASAFSMFGQSAAYQDKKKDDG